MKGLEVKATMNIYGELIVYEFLCHALYKVKIKIAALWMGTVRHRGIL